MTESSDLRLSRIPLSHGGGQIPALGFGTLIPAVLTTPKTAARAQESFNVSALPPDALDEINAIQIRQRLNQVVHTGIPGFIARATPA